MKTGVHNLDDLKVGDTIVVERWHTGPQLADYWYKRPWQVEHVYDGTVRKTLVVIGLNKNHTDRRIGLPKALTERMLEYGKIYKLTTAEDLATWVDDYKYRNY